MSLKNFMTIEDELRPILKQSEAARSDDMALYGYYVRRKTEDLELGDTWLRRVFFDSDFRKKHKIAAFSSVVRIRRKMQILDYTLRPTKDVLDERKDHEIDFRDYAREGATNERTAES